jgi:spore germination cell wall hydrolase CwlJ-like protein
VFSADEQQCLATGIYFEARGEPVKGQAAVAQVILNRVRNPAYPKTICGVVYQNEDWTNACQFSFACDKVKDKVNSPYHWQVARQVAMAVTAGKIWLPEVGSATHSTPSMSSRAGPTTWSRSGASACTCSTEPMAAAGADPRHAGSSRVRLSVVFSEATANRRISR